MNEAARERRSGYRRAPLSDQAKGILLMICAIALFTVLDALAKGIGQETNPVMALWARYAGQTVIVAVIVAPRLRRVLRTRYPKLQVLRSIFLLSATSCFFTGLTMIGLAEATAIMDLNPVIITLGAALILGERFGPRRAVGVVVSLIGALIVIRPGSEVFSYAALLPLAAALFYSGYALTTRFVGRDEDAWTSLLYSALLGAILFTALIPFFWEMPDLRTAGMMAVIGFCGAGSQLMLIRALMMAEASLIAPFAYVGLIFASLWGLLFFGEWPDLPTVIGMVVIAGAGLYVWHRETQLAGPSGSDTGGGAIRGREGNAGG
ncbi:DMT family transporter [Profundibacterium mesophilum]|uniref:EamA-like transporter family domain containing protein n=1 Tax=Profundibacterium mesophilum KAUST100406-0324 TaxID=1037889 RepID=A0A921TC82_9RHOB|nr:DMT family transporter [Profundibacterium mesophilum]KAF0674806.1 EamA-like transporter family domain containing protein [Profundibacterium mesophilum KAUST100406-0324]